MKKIKFWLIVICSLLVSLSSSAYSDSLQIEFYSTSDKEDSRVIAYQIAKKTIYSQPDTAIKYLHAAIKDSTFNPQSENLGNCLNAIGVYHFNKHNFDSVIYYSSRALKIFLDNDNPAGGIKMRKNIALARRSLGDYQAALKSFFKILDFYKSDSNDVRVAATLNDIGNTYSYLEDYYKSIHYQHEALAYLIEKSNNNLKGNIYNSLGYAYSALGKTDTAVLYYEISLELKLVGGNIYGIANTRNNLCTLIDYKEYPKKCEDCLLALLKDQKKINDSKGIARTFINLSSSDSYYNNCFLALQRLDSAGYYLSFSDDIFLKQDYFKQYAKVLNECGKNGLAYNYLDSLMKLNDSIFEFQKQREIFELDTKYQTQQKEENIKMLEAKNEFTTIKVQKQRWQISFLIFFLITVVGGGTLAFFLLKQRQRKLKELAILKIREEERVRISRDMHDEIGSGLTKISFMGEQFKLQNTEKNSDSISKIIKQSRLLSKNLREIIWAIDPRNDNLPEMLFYFRDYINDFCDNTNINCTISFDDDIKGFEIASEIRRNLFLVLKEILNNIAKHADANNVKVSFYLENNLGFLIVEDDGKGFNESLVRKGLGLDSLKSRTKKLNGILNINSSINTGTTVSLEQIILNTTKV